MKHEVKQKMHEDVSRRLGELRMLSYDEIRALPPRIDVQRTAGRFQYTVTTWMEPTEDKKAAVGVFACLEGRWNTTTAVHDGFLISKDGIREEMPMDMQVKNV